MKRLYLIPATQEQIMTVCQLMVGSNTQGININNDALEGTSNNIIYGG